MLIFVMLLKKISTFQLAVAKANIVGSSLDSVLSQDISPGDGGGLELGDSVEIKYTGWLLTDCAIGAMFDSNITAEKLLRFKVGKSKLVKVSQTRQLIIYLYMYPPYEHDE